MRRIRVKALREAYRDLGLSVIDRVFIQDHDGRPAYTNLRRRLRQFWNEFKRVPHSRAEIQGWDGR